MGGRQEAYGRWRGEGQDPREQYLHIVHEQVGRLLRRLPSGVVERDELISWGAIGLLEGIERYDAARGVPIEAFLRTRVRLRLIDGLRSQDRLPRRLRERERLVRQAYARLEQENLRSATDEEVAKALGIAPEEFSQWLQDLALSCVFSIDGLYAQGEEPEDGAPSPEELLEQDELHGLLAAAVSRLPRREQEVLWAHYQLGYAIGEVAGALGLSESYVSALHSRAILRLRGALSRYRAAAKRGGER